MGGWVRAALKQQTRVIHTSDSQLALIFVTANNIFSGRSFEDSAGQLCSVVDRLGRVLIDIAPHLHDAFTRRGSSTRNSASPELDPHSNLLSALSSSASSPVAASLWESLLRDRLL